MKFTLVIFFLYSFCDKPDEKVKNFGYKVYLKSGDILFRESASIQNKLFSEISESVLNDCGVVEINDENVWVWHVDKRVKRIPIDEWLLKGKSPYFVASRFADYNALISAKLKLALVRFKGRPEDFKYNWNSKAVYNAEFVRKLYTRIIGMEVTTLENQYIYRNGTSKVEFKNLVTPYQIYSSSFFTEVFNSFPQTKKETTEEGEDSIVSNY